ncbi:group II intron maturase-specific domain-containing protein, partial [Caballeronia sp. BR00000012568055]|uniref:group II intron maturase-specific domain-containing protein n=1 Tax=Caballeronia sp. BR00000012568055 TaxID=2918761 RepID=UPI0034D45F7B
MAAVWRQKTGHSVARSAALRQDLLIRALNPLIRGSANYHRHVVAKQIFSAVGHAIWQSLWRWARRRYANKGARWV